METTQAAPAADANKSTISINPRVLTKNDRQLTPIVNELKRGDNKGLKFPHVAVEVVYNEDKTMNEAATLANISAYCAWKGIANVARELTRSEKADANAALNAAATFVKDKRADDKGNLVEVDVITAVDEEKFFEYYLSDTMRGGTNITTLSDEKDDLNKEVLELFPKMAAETDPNKRNQLTQTIQSKIEEIQKLEEQIAARRRGPRSQQQAA